MAICVAAYSREEPARARATARQGQAERGVVFIVELDTFKEPYPYRVRRFDVGERPPDLGLRVTGVTVLFVACVVVELPRPRDTEVSGARAA